MFSFTLFLLNLSCLRRMVLKFYFTCGDVESHDVSITHVIQILDKGPQTVAMGCDDHLLSLLHTQQGHWFYFDSMQTKCTVFAHPIRHTPHTPHTHLHTLYAQRWDLYSKLLLRTRHITSKRTTSLHTRKLVKIRHVSSQK